MKLELAMLLLKARGDRDKPGLPIVMAPKTIFSFVFVAEDILTDNKIY
jgi:hypothetical protein